MAAFFGLAEGKASSSAVQNVIDDNAALVDGDWAAGDYDNSTHLDPFCDAYLTVQWDTTAPTAGDIVAELYIVPGDNAGSPVYPEGGDAGLGTDKIPQAVFLKGAFESVSPSTSVNEVLCLENVPLSIKNRFVLKNVSGQQFDLTWQLDIRPRRYEALAS